MHQWPLYYHVSPQVHPVIGAAATVIPQERVFFIATATVPPGTPWLGIPGMEPDIDPQMQLAYQASLER